MTTSESRQTAIESVFAPRATEIPEFEPFLQAQPFHLFRDARHRQKRRREQNRPLEVDDGEGIAVAEAVLLPQCRRQGQGPALPDLNGRHLRHTDNQNIRQRVPDIG